MRYRLLGPIEVRLAGRRVEFGGPRQRAVLAALVLGANDTVSIGRLCDAVWDVPPAAAESNVRTYVAQLPHLLAAEPEVRLETRHRGYRHVVPAGELDLTEFEELVDRGRHAAKAGDFPAAVRSFAAALELWRGRPFEDLEPGPALHAERARLDEQHLVAVERLLSARIELGEHEVVIAELRRLIAEHPTREKLAELLMLDRAVPTRHRTPCRCAGPHARHQHHSRRRLATRLCGRLDHLRRRHQPPFPDGRYHQQPAANLEPAWHGGDR